MILELTGVTTSPAAPSRPTATGDDGAADDRSTVGDADEADDAVGDGRRIESDDDESDGNVGAGCSRIGPHRRVRRPGASGERGRRRSGSRAGNQNRQPGRRRPMPASRRRRQQAVAARRPSGHGRATPPGQPERRTASRTTQGNDDDGEGGGRRRDAGAATATPGQQDEFTGEPIPVVGLPRPPRRRLRLPPGRRPAAVEGRLLRLGQAGPPVRSPQGRRRSPAAPARRSATRRTRRILRIDTVNDVALEPGTERPLFEELTAVFATERIDLGARRRADDRTVRAPSTCSPPSARAAACCSPRRPGRARPPCSQTIARSVEANEPDATLLVVLLDERPEEITEMAALRRRPARSTARPSTPIPTSTSPCSTSPSPGPGAWPRPATTSSSWSTASPASPVPSTPPARAPAAPSAASTTAAVAVGQAGLRRRPQPRGRRFGHPGRHGHGRHRLRHRRRRLRRRRRRGHHPDPPRPVRRRAPVVPGPRRRPDVDPTRGAPGRRRWRRPSARRCAGCSPACPTPESADHADGLDGLLDRLRNTKSNEELLKAAVKEDA